MFRIETVQDWRGGINNLPRPDLIPPHASMLVYDAVVDRVGQLLAREGTRCFGGAGQLSQGLALYHPPGVEPRLVGVWNQAAYISALNYTWAQGASGVSLVAGPHAAVVGRDANARWVLYLHSAAASPSDASFFHSCLVAWHPDSGDFTQYSYLRPGCAVFWQGRLWAADFAQTDLGRDTIAWSSIWNGGDWSAYRAQNVRVDPAIGGHITALVPARGEEPQLYVFKERAIYIFSVAWATDGWIPSSANDLDTDRSSIRTLSQQVGCIAPRTAIWVPSAENNDVFFLAHDGVRSLRRTQDDVAAGAVGPPLTSGMPDVICRINWAAAHRAVAAVYDNYYLCAVPMDGADHNTHVLVKNLLVGPYEGWTVWRLPVAGFATTGAPDPRLFFQCAVATSDTLYGATGATLAAAVFEIDEDADAIDPGGSLIQPQVDTRAFGGDAPGLRKQWRWLEVEHQAEDTGSTLLLFASIDMEDTWATLTAFYAAPYNAAITLPAALPWVFSRDRVQLHRCGLENINPAYNIAFRLQSNGIGRLRLHRLSVVSAPLGREWQ